MLATVFGASSGYVSNSNDPFDVSTTITRPAPGVGGVAAAAGGAFAAPGFGAGFAAPGFACVPAGGLAGGRGAVLGGAPVFGAVLGGGLSFGGACAAAAVVPAIVSAASRANAVLRYVRIHFSLPTRWTPSLGHSSRMAQALHRGNTGRQTFCPQVTRYRLMYGHHRCSIDAYSACSVSSGVVVVTQPRRFEMRWTCVSTQMLC